MLDYLLLIVDTLSNDPSLVKPSPQRPQGEVAWALVRRGYALKLGLVKLEYPSEISHKQKGVVCFYFIMLPHGVLSHSGNQSRI